MRRRIEAANPGEVSGGRAMRRLACPRSGHESSGRLPYESTKPVLGNDAAVTRCSTRGSMRGAPTHHRPVLRVLVNGRSEKMADREPRYW